MVSGTGALSKTYDKSSTNAERAGSPRAEVPALHTGGRHCRQTATPQATRNEPQQPPEQNRSTLLSQQKATTESQRILI